MDSLLFHPKIVHLPMALAVLMPLIAGGLLFAWWRRWLPSRAWVIAVALQAVLVGSGFMALRSGENEEERVEQVVPEAALEAHEEAAEGFMVAGGVVLVIMGAAAVLASRKLGPAIAGLGALGTVVVLVMGVRVGEAGGALVYQHGAAQAYVGQAAPGGAPGGVTPGGAPGDDD